MPLRRFDVLYWFVAAVVITWSVYLYYVNQLKDKGVFGDMFGGLNTLFSGLTLAAVVYTIMLQRDIIKLQKEELTDTKNEFKAQNKGLSIQRFETTFFNLLQLHHELIEKLSALDSRNEPIYGRAVFESAFKDFDRFLKYERQNQSRTGITPGQPSSEPGSVEDLMNEIKHINNAYTNMYKERYRNSLLHYHRNLYHIFKFVYLSDEVDFRKKDFYYNIIKAQLSNAELIMIYYNAFVAQLGYPKMKYLIDEIDILENLDGGLVLLPTHHEAFRLRKIDFDPFKNERE